MSQKWKGGTGGGNFGQKSIIWLLKIFGLRTLYVVVALFSPFFIAFFHKGFVAIYHFFREQLAYSPFKSFCASYKNHLVFSQIILDRFAVYSGKKDIFDVKIEKYDIFHNLDNGKKGFVMLGSHFGNFEIIGYFLKPEKKTVNAIVFDSETEVMRENRTKAFEQNNIRIVSVLPDMSHIFAANTALQTGEIVSLPADRLFGSNKSVRCGFFNGEVDFPIGAFALAKSADVEVIAIFCVKTGFKKYSILIEKIGHINQDGDTKAQTTEMVKRYASKLEIVVRQYPLQWFNFYEFWK